MRLLIFMLIFGFGTAFSDDNPQYDTIVVGIGSAGTTAASTLARAGKRVLALEAQNRVGGRVNTVEFGRGVVELGAEWLHGIVNHRGYDLATQNNITITEQDFTNEKFYISDGSEIDEDMLEDVFRYYFVEVMNKVPEVHQSMAEQGIKSIKQYISEKYPETAKNTAFVDQLITLIGLGVDTYNGDHWSMVSTWSKYEELEGSQYSTWGRNGYKTFFDLLLNKYNNGPGLPTLEIKLNTEVTKITWPQDSKLPVTVTTKDGATYTAKNVIVTVSVGVLKERYTTLFTPELPLLKVNAIRNISMGLIDKILLSFDEIWWPKNVTSYAFLWTAEDQKKMGDDWTTKVFGASSPAGSENVLTLWVSGETARQIENVPEDEIKTKSMVLLRRFMGRNTTIPDPSGIIRTQWVTNPFTLGSYTHRYVRLCYTYDNMNIAAYPSVRVDLASPLIDDSNAPRVLFAGEATDTKHHSTVHGASDSGYRAAMLLIRLDEINH